MEKTPKGLFRGSGHASLRGVQGCCRQPARCCATRPGNPRLRSEAVLRFLTAHLFFPDFVELLAVDTLGGGGTGFQAADADLDAAGVAEAVLAGLQVGQGLVDLLDELAL